MTSSTFLSFKNVGINQFTVSTTAPSASLFPIGIKTPLSLGETSGDGLLTMNYVVAEQIQDNFKNLLLTNHGERVVIYDFGANLRPLATEFTNKDNFDAAAMNNIAVAAAKYMPFISLEEFQSNVDMISNQIVGKIGITVIYSVPNLNIIRKSIKVVLYVI